MRLIDADKLKSELAKWFPMASLDGIEAKTLFAQIMHDIDNEPDEMTQDLINKVNVNVGLAKPIKDERPQCDKRQ